MAEFPGLTIWTDAYLGDTTHLTTIEHGAYFLLLVTAWRCKTHDLPDDDRQLARFVRMTPGQWARIRPTMEQFWTISGGRWVNGRLLDELDAARKRSIAASTAGKASAKAAVERRKNRNATPGQRIPAPANLDQGLNDGPVRQDHQEPSDSFEGLTPEAVRQHTLGLSDGSDRNPLENNAEVATGVERQADAGATSISTAITITTPVEDKSSTGASAGVVVPFAAKAPDGKPDWWPRRDRYGRVLGEITDKLLYDVGKAVLGPSAGGLITRLKKVAPYRSDWRAAVELLLRADDTSDPKPWFAQALRNAEMDEPLDPKHVVFPESEYRER